MAEYANEIGEDGWCRFVFDSAGGRRPSPGGRAPTNQSMAAVVCENCGTRNPAERQFCEYCDAPIQTRPSR